MAASLGFRTAPNRSTLWEVFRVIDMAWFEKALLLAIVLLMALLEGDLWPCVWFDWLSFWTGHHLIAMPFLLAAWAALGSRPLATRLPQALAVASIVALVQAWGANRYRLAEPVSALGAVLVFVLFLILPMLLLAIVRRRRGWRIGLPGDRPLPVAERWQFSLRQLLAWLAGTATVLSLAAWISPGAPLLDSRVDAVSLLIFVVLAWLVSLPMVPALPAMLREGGRGRLFAWSLATTAALWTLIFGLFCGMYYLDERPATAAERADVVQMAAVQTGSLALGLLATCFGVLAVFRLSGYRLTRSGDDRMAETPAAGQLSPPAVGRGRRFLALAAMFALAIAALYWPARAIDRQRSRDYRDRQLTAQWKALGVQAVVQEGLVYSLEFRADEALSDAIIERIEGIAGNDRLNYFRLSNRPITDEQLRRLGSLKSIRALSLDGTQVTDAGLVHLPATGNLQEVNLAGTAVTDAGLETLARIESLTTIGLDGTSITDAGLARLTSMPNLKVVYLSKTNVTPKAAAAFEASMPGRYAVAQGLDSIFRGANLVRQAARTSE